MAQSISAYFAYGQIIGIDGAQSSRRSSVSSTYSSEVNNYVNSIDRSGSPENAFVDYGQSPSTTFDIESNAELGDKNTDSIALRRQVEESTKFVFRRFFAFMLWGFIMAFIQVAWYLFLNSMYTDDPTFVGVLERDLTDQLCFSPISLACFFTYGTIVIESGTMDDAKSKLYRIYISTLACNFCLWFPVQFINFLIIPKRFQVPFSSTIGVMWNCFLSFRNASAGK
ncbi:DEKNAAC101395 [Brettanomyces naardenensis]|uniref:DEKNAAC101395 n=1 Tax=Brettanomyces naardenensis TaxID=13370 RepID=A0A448YI93_BRENA|nr:DEKNAAC101395 [Brettanomyces naardenensis]